MSAVRAQVQPLHGHAEPAHLLSHVAACLASGEHRGRLSGRFATCCEAVVLHDTRAVAARQPPLTEAVGMRGVAQLERRRSRRAQLLPLRGHPEPARLLSRSVECLHSSEHHGTLSGRLTTSSDAVVPHDMRASAARQPSLTAAVIMRAVALLDRRRSQRAPLLLLRVHAEPARLLSRSAECLFSAEHHG